MRLRPGVIAACGVGGLALVAASLWTVFGAGADAAGYKWKVIVPGAARDSGAAAVPSPTVGTGDRDINVVIDILAHELSLTEGGTTDVRIIATADTHLPGMFDPPRTVTGTISVFVLHPTDAEGHCTWTRVFANPELKMTVSQPQSSSLSALIQFQGAEWHYEVVCKGPGGEVHVRVPATGEESLTGLLGFLFPGRGGPTGVVVATPVYSGAPDCIKRKAVEQGSGILAEGTVTVTVYEPPCLLPIPGE